MSDARGPKIARGLQHGLLAVALELGLLAALSGLGPGTVAQAAGAAMATLACFLSAIFLGARLRPPRERAPFPASALFAFAAPVVAFGAIGVLFYVDGAEGVARGTEPHAAFATSLAGLPALALGALGMALGRNAERRSLWAAPLALLALCALQIGSGLLAVRVSYDPAIVNAAVIAGSVLSFLIVGVGLAVALGRLGFVELSFAAVGFGYALYLLAAHRGGPLLATASIPKEQVLVILAVAPTAIGFCLLTVGASLGFMFTGGGRFDPSFSYELELARRYLRLDIKAADLFRELVLLVFAPAFTLVMVLFPGARRAASRLRSSMGTILIISLLGVALGVMALVVVLSVMSGFENDLKTKILGAHAHVLVNKHGDDFTEYAELEERLKSVRGVNVAAAFVMGEGMISSESGLSGVMVKGLDPRNEGAVRYLRENMKQGDVDWLLDPERIPVTGRRLPITGTSTGPDFASPALTAPELSRKLPGVVIGRELAKTLRVRLGQTVNVVSPTSEEIGPSGPQPKLRRFRVAGIFFSGMYEYDSKFAYVEMRQAQRFFGLRNKATAIELRVADIDDTSLIVEEIKRRVGGYPYAVKDWRQMNKELFSALLLEKLAMFIVLTFIVLVASFNIVSTLVMIVLERTREIAILKSMGASEVSVMKVFVVQGLIVGFGGALLGLAGGIGICLLVSTFGIPLDPEVFYIDRLPVVMDRNEILTIGVAAVVITYLATIYPGLAAAALRPVEGLRDD